MPDQLEGEEMRPMSSCPHGGEVWAPEHVSAGQFNPRVPCGDLGQLCPMCVRDGNRNGGEGAEIRRLHGLLMECATAAGVWKLSDTVSPDIMATWPEAIRAEVDRLREAVDEREGDLHARIRAGYDATIADSWRAAIAKEQAEVERLRGLLAALDEKVSAVMPSMPLEKFAAHFDMECSRVRWQRVLEVLQEARKEVGRG